MADVVQVHDRRGPDLDLELDGRLERGRLEGAVEMEIEGLLPDAELILEAEDLEFLLIVRIALEGLVRLLERLGVLAHNRRSE